VCPQHETVTALAAAAKEGNRAKMDDLSLRRAGLKEDLRKAVDEIHEFEIEFNVRSSVADRPSLSFESPQSSSRFSLTSSMPMDTEVPPTPPRHGDTAGLQDRLSVMRADLVCLFLHSSCTGVMMTDVVLSISQHDTVTQLARAASAKDTRLMKELSDRRLHLKEEVKAIQEEFQQITRESMTLPPMPPVPTRNSLGPDGQTRGSMDRIQVADGRDRSGSRSSSLSTTSHASQAMSVDSSANFSMAPPKANAHVNVGAVPGGNVMPTMSGLLMKHPSHSNERGLFGNITLRGVRERYCALDGTGSLAYYKRKGDREPRGTIPLDIPSLEVIYAQNEIKSSEFSICTPTHQNKFVAKTRDEMLRWVKALEATHAMLMSQRNGASASGHSSTSKENRLRQQESVISNEDSPDGRNSNDGLAPAALAAAAAADAASEQRGSMSARRSSGSQHHRATLGF
jgi:hypothetical protein